MRKTSINILVVFLVIGLGMMPVVAQNTIHGPLSGTLGPGTYIVDGDCQVLAGESLMINPGTIFLHCGPYRWYIHGELNAMGSEEEPITFVRQNPIEAHKWGGLRFEPDASPQSIVKWCEFDFCKNTEYPDYRGGAIYINEVAITIINCTMTNGESEYGAGIYATDITGLVVDKCIVTGNTSGSGAGIHLVDCNSALVTNCYVYDNTSTSN